MSGLFSRIRWRLVVGAAFAVMALSFLIPIVIVTVYAFTLAFQARGAPDQTAINRFAAGVTPQLMPWSERVVTLLVAFRVSSTMGQGGAVVGLLIGIVAGLLSLSLTLAFGGRLGLHTLLIFAIVVALGWLGGFIGEKTATSARGRSRAKSSVS